MYLLANNTAESFMLLLVGLVFGLAVGVVFTLSMRWPTLCTIVFTLQELCGSDELIMPCLRLVSS